MASRKFHGMKRFAIPRMLRKLLLSNQSSFGLDCIPIHTLRERSEVVGSSLGPTVFQQTPERASIPRSALVPCFVFPGPYFLRTTAEGPDSSRAALMGTSPSRMMKRERKGGTPERARKCERATR